MIRILIKMKKQSPIKIQIMFAHHIIDYAIQLYNSQGNRSNILNANEKNLSQSHQKYWWTKKFIYHIMLKVSAILHKPLRI